MTMESGEREAAHLAAEARMRSFAYEKPDGDNVKTIAWLVKDSQFTVAVQVVKDGGENNLHHHTNASQVYFVLAGCARFYGPGDALIAELLPQHGLFIPAEARYWFEKTGAEDLQMLQIVSRSGKSERVNLDPLKPWMVGRELGRTDLASEAGTSA